MSPRLYAIGALCLFTPLLSAATLSFEGLPVNLILSNEFQASDSIVFVNNARVHFLGAGHATEGILGLFNGNTVISAEFRLPGGQDAATTSVQVKGDLIPIPGNVILRGYDVNGNLVDEATDSDIPAPATLSISGAGIHRIEMFSESGTVGFDELTFTTPVLIPDQTGVPEPGTISMLAAGLIALAIRLKSRG